MNKRKKILIYFGLILPIILTGCSNQEELSLEGDTKVILEPTDEELVEYDKVVEGYELLECYNRNVYPNLTYLALNTDNENLYYDTADKIKSLLGNNLELVPIELSSNAPEVYHLKGFEENKDINVVEQKYIELALQETSTEDFYNPPSEKISFISSSKESSTKALELMLSMEDEINTMLNNLLEKQEAKEILKFLKEEISRIESENKTQSYVSISINTDIKLIYIYAYDEENDIYYNRFTLDSSAPMAKMLEQLN